MRLGYYPGCALKAHATGLEYGASADAVFRALDIELKEIPDWNCCGASAAHMTNLALTRALNVRNLALAEAAGYTDLLAPCPLCAKELAVANKEVREDAALLKEAEEAAEMVYKGSVRVLTLIQFLYEQRKSIEQRLTAKLPAIKVACYYGCLHTRPHGVMGFDDAEQPSTMDQVCQMLGLDPVQWSHKTECCGAGFTMSRADVVARLSGRILSAAKLAGTEAVIVACPMCQANLDMRQAEAAADAGEDFRLPVLYLTQVIGLALGLEPDVLGLKTHFVDTTAIVARLRGQAQAPAVAVGAAQEK